MNRWFVFTLLTCFLLLVVGVACESQASQTYRRVSQPMFQAGDILPKPTGEVILTVSGKIGSRNSGDLLLLDMETLEKFGLVEYELNDPWLKRVVTYRGVLMSDFLEIIQAAEDAELVHFVALDDYEVDITLQEIRKWPILLATQADGKYMAVSENGPTRIIFPFDQFPEIDQSVYRDLMIWNIESMEVR
ncbi:MAG: molybdopterin-dependent oxidoreductase [Anaerolineales bacterium]|nr:molybdopterin-dependent oxidoreductase [Anaerolineales bacterium]MCX7608948.1 molybdopterin-dependent oxidoreductase [Anaerolineales bacterium]